MRSIDKIFLIGLLAESTLPIEVWAGSPEIGNANLDLVIRSKNLTHLNEEIITMLYKKIRNSNLYSKVKIRDWTKLPNGIQNNISQEYDLLFDSSINLDNTESFEEPLVNIYNSTNTIRFFDSFEESEDYLRLKMAKMSHEERLIQLKKIRAISGRLTPNKQTSELNLLTIKIEIGVTK